MRTIWKFPIELEVFSEMLHEGYEVLHVGLQEGLDGKSIPCLWVEVETTRPARPAFFRIYGTGHPIDSVARHLGTWIVPPFVWHLYEVADGQGVD
jgi:hypothetical protein